MYNRYIPDSAPYRRISEGDAPSFRPAGSRPSGRPQSSQGRTRKPGPTGPLDGITSLLSGLFKQFHLEDIDSGDILLVLILLFLFLESDDNLELVITLGLLLLFGLFSKEDRTPPEPEEDEPEEVF